MDAAVDATNLTKSYGDTVALSGVSLTVERGEVFALIGPNGAGKTTLVRTLTGTAVPDEGAVRVLERAPTDLERARIGVLPQAFSPQPRLSARELLAYYAGLYDEARDPETVLADVGLTGAGDTRYENLSGGQQRRVCVGAALVNDPEVLVLDEPTTGIDPAGRRTVWRLLEGLADAGTTVLLTTHDMAEAARLGDRVGLLADGDLVALGTPEALIDAHAGPSSLTVSLATDETLEPIRADLESALEFAVEVDARESDLLVRDVSPADIARVVDALAERGLEYTSLEWAEPDLEDVYLALAGETEALATRAAGTADPTGPAERSSDETGDGGEER
ncbi:ABC transporter ATP-binding protein [Natronobiforma cellulositropha]|uniref:ABC transporter ATP-binding protein n=1 Tax=Natronobiforma cellulositropha TaxID=1679076 RepID=UPI0021D5F580|nr:ABC transporter ATP-binding protein [Natronobiforma cellulositropha]